MDGLIFHNIARLADAKTQARMIKSIREMSFAGSRRCYYGAANQQKIRLPIKFTMDNRYNVYFFENNIKFTIYATYWQYHPQPITMSSIIYAEYIKNGGLNIIVKGEANGEAIGEAKGEVCLKYDTSKLSRDVLRTKYDAIVGIGEKI
jgi:hypothetical protein